MKRLALSAIAPGPAINSTSRDIGGWFLSDDAAVPKKFRIPPGTTIPANGYVVFTEADFNKPGASNAFNFRSTGDEVYLYSADANTNLTGYIHGFEFEASLNGVTFGRHGNSVGQVSHVAQSCSTLGGTNAYPLVGPLVISEIMFHPPDLVVDGRLTSNKTDEYLELHNLTSSDLPLYDTNHPANTWRLRGGVEYDFPLGLVGC